MIAGAAFLFMAYSIYIKFLATDSWKRVFMDDWDTVNQTFTKDEIMEVKRIKLDEEDCDEIKKIES